MFLLERFELWLAGSRAADLGDPTLYGAQLVNPTMRNATLESPLFLGVPTGPTPPVGTNTGQIATSASLVATTNEILHRFIPLINASGQNLAGSAAATYLLGSQSQVLVVGGNALQPVQTFLVSAADVPTFVGSSPKYRVRTQINTNGTAPTGNYTVGLYPITGTSGAAGGITYAVGTVVAGSTATVTGLGANASVNATSSEFPLPPDGLYALGVVTSAAAAASSHTVIVAQLRTHFSSP